MRFFGRILHVVFTFFFPVLLQSATVALCLRIDFQAFGTETLTHFPATGGRICVLGIFLGVISTVVTCIFAINIYVQFFFNISSDFATTRLPSGVYQHLDFMRYLNHSVILSIGLFACLLSLYIIV